MREIFIKQKILTVYKECNIRTFPINCSDILLHYGFTVRTYAEAKLIDPELYAYIRSFTDDALKYHKCIYYNEKVNAGRVRFSLMHELGHYILGHKGQYQKNEDEADYFASNILAPRSLMYSLGCKNAEDVHTTFQISYAAANNAWTNYRHCYWTEADKSLRELIFTTQVNKTPELNISTLQVEKSNIIEDFSESSNSATAWLPSKGFEERRAKVLARIRRQKRKIQKQLKQYEEDMEILGGYDPDVAFARAERQWLYGNDL